MNSFKISLCQNNVMVEKKVEELHPNHEVQLLKIQRGQLPQWYPKLEKKPKEVLVDELTQLGTHPYKQKPQGGRLLNSHSED